MGSYKPNGNRTGNNIFISCLSFIRLQKYDLILIQPKKNRENFTES